MKSISRLENQIVKEEAGARADFESETQRLSLELTELNAAIASSEQERKALILTERAEHNLRNQAGQERVKSRTLEREMEKVLQDLREERQQSWDSYVARRDKRRKDVMVLHTAVNLVCTFNTFKDDERCTLNRISSIVPLPPNTPIHADMSEKQLQEQVRARQQDTAAWEQQRQADEQDIKDGKLPADYVYQQDDQSMERSALALVQTGKTSPADVAAQLLNTEASARAAAPLQTLLIAVQSGDYEKSSKLLDLVLGLIQEVEDEQKQDSSATKKEQKSIQKRIEEQDLAQQAEESKQETLLHSMQEHLRQARTFKQQAWARVQIINTKEKLVESTKEHMTQLRLEYRAKKQIRDEEMSNIERLRSLLLVLTGASNAPTCDNNEMRKCTNANQGMCVFSTGPVKRDTKEYCACEWGFYGPACENKKCPGKVPGTKSDVLFEANALGACGGLDNGKCEEPAGTCTCQDHTAGKDCSKYTTCAGGTGCSGHGSCDLTIGKCLCGKEYYGEDCSFRKCPGNQMEGTLNKFQAGHPLACQGHGICQKDGKCECAHGYKGGYCHKKQCLDNCSGRGTCDENTGVCACEPGFSGSSCRYRECPNQCGGQANGVCDRDSGICRCNKGFSGPGCVKTHTCNAKETTYKDWALALPGWSKCPIGSFVTGFKTGDCTSINCIDKARCSNACAGQQTVEVSHCYQANWWDSLNKKGWSMCREPYFLAGLYRNKCDSLYCIEMGLCCSLRGVSWDACSHADAWKQTMSKRQKWSEVPTNHFVTGIFRAGLTSELKDIHKAAHCSFKLDQQIKLD